MALASSRGRNYRREDVLADVVTLEACTFIMPEEGRGERGCVQGTRTGRTRLLMWIAVGANVQAVVSRAGRGDDRRTRPPPPSTWTAPYCRPVRTYRTHSP